MKNALHPSLPLIQELPLTYKPADLNNSTTTNAAARTAYAKKPTPGWAYVPDTGYDPSKAAIVPASGTRRGVTRAGGGGGAGGGSGVVGPLGRESAQRRSKINQHLAALDRENHRDVQIPLPERDSGVKGLRKQPTPNVKKILNSAKTFINYLADEEAAIANAPPPKDPVFTPQKTATAKATGKSTAATKGKRRSSAAGTRCSSVTDPDAMEIDEPVSSAATPVAAAGEGTSSQPPDGPASAPKESEPHDPRINVLVPKAPTHDELETLLAAPPLSYSAAAAAPSTSTLPPRQFCEICGYWGRVRCMKCGAKVCGIECREQHEETSCMKFWL